MAQITHTTHILLLGTAAALGVAVVATLRGSGRLATAASDVWLAVEAGEPEGELPSIARRAGRFVLTIVALSLPSNGLRR
jgi:hypothetical protein